MGLRSPILPSLNVPTSRIAAPALSAAARPHAADDDVVGLTVADYPGRAQPQRCLLLISSMPGYSRLPAHAPGR
jgi:hypothetical protein